MKKYFRIFSLLLLVIFFGVMDVNAMSLQPTGDKSSVRGNDISIYITLNKSENEKSVSAVEGIFSFDESVFTLGSVSNLIGNEWVEFSPVTNNGKFSYANLMFNKLITSNTNLLKVNLKVKDNAKYGDTVITVKDTSGTDDTGSGLSISSGNHTIRILSDENKLASLSVTGADLKFEEDTVTYSLEIDSDKTTITATTKDNNSKLTGDVGEKTLKYGLNTFKVTVTSESSIAKEYTINVTRPDKRSSENALSNIKLSKGTIKFKSDTLNYNVEVENNVAEVNIEATLKDEKSTFVNGFGSRKVVLKEGKNVYLIKVQAENETIKTYTLNITRKSNKSSNSYLSELKLSDGTINFDKNTTEYNVSVLYDIENIEIEAKTEDSKAKYEIVGETELVVGENVITVKVTAEDQSTTEYKIIVTRKEESEKLSSNSRLSSLTIEGYNIGFNSDKYEYTLKINDETTLSIKYVLEDENSVVTIDGNNNLKDGSVINITSTAEDGSKSVYKINIELDNGSILIFVIIGIVLLLVIGVVVFLLMKKKKNDNNNSNGNNSNIQNTIKTENAISDIPVKTETVKYAVDESLNKNSEIVNSTSQTDLINQNSPVETVSVQSVTSVAPTVSESSSNTNTVSVVNNIATVQENANPVVVENITSNVAPTANVSEQPTVIPTVVNPGVAETGVFSQQPESNGSSNN